MNLKLVKPSSSLKKSFLEGLLECESEGSGQSWIYLHESEISFAKENFPKYVEKLLSY